MPLLPLLVALCLSACLDSAPKNTAGFWSVPQSEVLDGGPGKDGIPAVDAPQFYQDASGLVMADDELVVAFRFGNDVRAYPHQVLDYHEVVNDTFNNTEVVISYCPLTGSSMVWQGEAVSSNQSFGVSGLLYNSNLILYDRATNSHWSQMLMQSINGTRIHQISTQLVSSEMSWGTWKKLYPSKPVLNFNTGFSRPYGRYPYGSYKDSDATIFPANNSNDERFSAKQRVLGVKVLESFKAYSIANFSSDGITVIADTIGGEPLTVWGSQNLNIAVVFNRLLGDGSLLSFSALAPQAFPALVTDDEGNHWDVFGVAISGPRQGQSLNQPFSFIAYWFAWAAFYPDTQVFEVDQ